LTVATGNARRLEGAPFATEIRERVAVEVATYTREQGHPPGLAVVVCGRSAPSMVYLQRILKACADVGIDGSLVDVDGADAAAQEAELTTAIELTTTHSTHDAATVAKMITRGQFSRSFWPGVILAGQNLPLLPFIFAPTPPGPPALPLLARPHPPSAPLWSLGRKRPGGAAPAPAQGDGSSYQPPRTFTEEALCRMWGALLEMERVGIHDNFFHLGGHSLLATQVVSRVRAELGVEVSLRTLFAGPTVADRELVLGVRQRVPPHPCRPRARNRASTLPGERRVRLCAR